MIFVIYIIIQIREYVYLNIIPKIDFIIVGRSCQRRRRLRRRLRGLAPLPMMPELQKFHIEIVTISLDKENGYSVKINKTGVKKISPEDGVQLVR